MILPIIRGHNLEGYILRTKVFPQEFTGTQITGKAGTSVEMVKNPKYCQWMSTDQLLMGWLYSSNELWIANEESYGVQNRSRITFLTAELQKSRKGNMSIDQYLNKVMQLVDNLEITGKTIIQSDLIIQVWQVLMKTITQPVYSELSL